MNGNRWEDGWWTCTELVIRTEEVTHWLGTENAWLNWLLMTGNTGRKFEQRKNVKNVMQWKMPFVLVKIFASVAPGWWNQLPLHVPQMSTMSLGLILKLTKSWHLVNGCIFMSNNNCCFNDLVFGVIFLLFAVFVLTNGSCFEMC